MVKLKDMYKRTHLKKCCTCVGYDLLIEERCEKCIYKNKDSEEDLEEVR